MLGPVTITTVERFFWRFERRLLEGFGGDGTGGELVARNGDAANGSCGGRRGKNGKEAVQKCGEVACAR